MGDAALAAEDLTEYREHARRARELAERAATAEERELLLSVAHHWDALAEIIERLAAQRGS
jgi:hypothetical protein